MTVSPAFCTSTTANKAQAIYRDFRHRDRHSVLLYFCHTPYISNDVIFAPEAFAAQSEHITLQTIGECTWSTHPTTGGTAKGPFTGWASEETQS